MQFCNLTLRLGGLLTSTVFKTDVSMPEVLILRHLHGDDAVNDIVPTEFRAVAQSEEWDRLARTYDQLAGSASPTGDRPSVMGSLFPGAVRRLPVSLTEIGLPHLEPAVKVSKRKSAPAAPPIVQPETTGFLLEDQERALQAALAAESAGQAGGDDEGASEAEDESEDA